MLCLCMSFILINFSVVSRCEIDLDEIKSEYLKIFHKTLYHSIQTRISGDYRTAMLTLIGTP
jgi:hypothetical protein